MKQRAAMGAGKVQQMAMNFVLTGNPGTGKTSIARKMGEILQSMDILPTSRVLEVSRATLVGKYMGETPKIVNNMCDKAIGGILFIDEAYTLSEGGDQYGKEAIDTLMKRMEDDRGKFVVIAAGYKDKMEDFMMMNPGLASRFTHKLHIDDYNEDERRQSTRHLTPFTRWCWPRMSLGAMPVRCVTCWMPQFRSCLSVCRRCQVTR